MKTKIDNLISSAHEVIDAGDVNTSILLFTAHTNVSVNAYGNTVKLGQMLYSAAKANESIKELIISVADTLQEDDE
jgi:predicted DNA-binding ArsR family transcriptional regulator